MKHIVPALLVFLLVAGCQSINPVTPSEDEPEPPWEFPPIYEVKGCVRHVCPPDPDDDGDRSILKHYGLAAISHSDQEVGVDFPEIDGNLVAWLADHGADGDMVIYNMSSHRLIPVSVDPGNHTTRFGLSDGRLAFTQSTITPDGLVGTDYAFLYDSRTGALNRIHTNLTGDQVVMAFGGSWVVVQTRGNRVPSDNGIWAINVDDGRRVQLWERPPKFKIDNRTEQPGEAAVVDGHAYLRIYRSNSTINSYNVTIYDWDLNSRLARDLFVGGGFGGVRLDASEHYVVWEEFNSDQDAYIHVFDRTNETQFRVNQFIDYGAIFPRVGGDWVTFYSKPMNDTGDWGIMAVHLPTGSRHVVLKENYWELGAALQGQISDTDGQRVVMALYRNPVDGLTQGMDLYWRPVPDLP